jgi:hypothetical protein
MRIMDVLQDGAEIHDVDTSRRHRGMRQHAVISIDASPPSRFHSVLANIDSNDIPT